MQDHPTPFVAFELGVDYDADFLKGALGVANEIYKRFHLSGKPGEIRIASVEVTDPNSITWENVGSPGVKITSTSYQVNLTLGQKECYLFIIFGSDGSYGVSEGNLPDYKDHGSDLRYNWKAQVEILLAELKELLEREETKANSSDFINRLHQKAESISAELH